MHLTEALVKSVKYALNTTIGNTVMIFRELQPVTFESAQIVNHRTIGQHLTRPEDGWNLCRNDIRL